jgi:ATP/ADP translocase
MDKNNEVFKVGLNGYEMLFILLGLVLFLISIQFLDSQTYSAFQNKPIGSPFWTFIQITTFGSFLILFVLASIFGNKNANDEYEFDSKYRFIKPILDLAVMLPLLSVGSMFGVLYLICAKNI